VLNIEKVRSEGLVVAPTLEAIQIHLDRLACARSFVEFVKRAWHIVEPQTPLKWGWALDAMCEHLEAVTWGEILRLLMNVPPGTMKSKLVGVFWPAWEWGPAGLPHLRYLGTSHKEELAIRDNLLCRRLIQSDWYQKRWPIKLTTDQNAKKKFENSSTGFREAMAFTSMTGSRGDRVLLDDPHSVDDANSPTELQNVRTTFREALPTRVNNDQSAIVVIMQRLNQVDVSGVILDEGFDYVHLMLPMRYEPERRCTTVIGFKDPRTRAGELLFPERFSEEQVSKLEKELGSYAAAGQLQQRPVPREGGMFKREWFEGKIIELSDIPAGTTFVRHWDLAATKSADAAYTAGVRIGKTPDGRFIVTHVHRKQMEGHAVRKAIIQQSDIDGYDTLISLPQDPGQAGKVQKQDFAALLAGRKFRIQLESGDKETRAEPFAAQCEAGNVYLLRGAWIDSYLDELCMFPGGKFKDQVDASSGAFGQLVTRRIPKTSFTTTKAY
jgi:predicted phage terminase large subunit-like protein